MKTRVVNIRKGVYDVYIGRAGYGEDGYFGNPVKLNCVCCVCGDIHTTKSATLVCYEKYFYARIASDTAFLSSVLSLRGKRLGCFCHPSACHGDVIASFLNEKDRNLFD